MTDAHLFDPGDPIAPEAAPDANLGADARRTLRRNQQLAAGIHPRTRLPILEPRVSTCGDCIFHFERRMASTYQKCGYSYAAYQHGDGHITYLNVSGGPGTDVRLSWPACSAYKPKTQPTDHSGLTVEDITHAYEEATPRINRDGTTPVKKTDG